MESSPSVVTNKFARKRKRDPENWSRNQAKKLRYSPKSMPEKVCNHNSKALKCDTLTMSQMKKLHDKFYSYRTKKDQDSIILKYCTVEPVKQRAGFKGKKVTTIKYGVFVGGKKVPICQKFFLNLFGVTKHRVQYVMNRYFHVGDLIITEHRGGNRKERLFAAQKESVHNFIQQLRCVEAHHCRKTKTAERKYLPSDLNINKLYKIYKDSEYSNVAVKKSYFRHIFNTNYNLGFGTPKTDVCSKCLELSGKIAAETDPQKKNLLIIEKRAHSLRAKAFYDKLKDTSDNLKILSFDCQKNLPLPKVPDQTAYYSRQIYFFNFTVVEGPSNAPLVKERVFTYYCTENEFNKDSNLVASAITHRLNNTNLINISTIRLVADGCGGQNKNCILLGTCSKWLLDHKNIKTIELVFPVTGHSFMPADRQFGIAEKKLRKMDVILHPDKIRDVLGETSTLIKLGNDCPVFNWRDAVKNVLKPTASWRMKFKQCKRFVLRRSKIAGNVLIKGELYYNSDTAQAQNVCQRNKNINNIIPVQLPSIVAVNKDKLSDVKRLLCKHFGAEWKEIPTLSYYCNIFDEQESLDASTIPPSDYCEEALEEVPDLRI